MSVPKVVGGIVLLLLAALKTGATIWQLNQPLNGDSEHPRAYALGELTGGLTAALILTALGVWLLLKSRKNNSLSAR